MAETNGYEIQRVLSNNVVLVRDPSTGSEMILTGKGIGFGKNQASNLTIRIH
nr:CAT RNA binding domain-containing protein [Paenibacillus larvae]